MIGFISKLFGGSKSEKDVKKIQPFIAEVNKFFEEYKKLNNDELRQKTTEFKNYIQSQLVQVDKEIATKKSDADSLPETDIHKKESAYNEVDKLIKKRDEQIEVALEALLPKAFAVIKETSRRFSENDEIEATATEQDINLAANNQYVRVENGKSYFKNNWLAAGVLVRWNMVHYDVYSFTC